MSFLNFQKIFPTVFAYPNQKEKQKQEKQRRKGQKDKARGREEGKEGQRRWKERRKMKQANQVVAREHLARIKLLDASDSHLLGITLEEYAKIKQDPRIVGMLKEMLEVELDRHYTDDEAEFDAKNLNISVEKAKENRASGIIKRIENVKRWSKEY